MVLLVMGIAAVASSLQRAYGWSEKGIEERFFSQKWDRHDKIDITSDQMTAEFETHTITFIGNVEARQADLLLTANKIVSVFGQEAQEIKKIVAEGNVRVQKGEKVATGEKAVYVKEEATITIEGNPRLMQGNDVVQGERIVVYLDKNQMEIHGRVKAEFQAIEQGPFR